LKLKEERKRIGETLLEGMTERERVILIEREER
jgi:hypothetical protein